MCSLTQENETQSGSATKCGPPVTGRFKNVREKDNP
jgi:hypothetical protein